MEASILMMSLFDVLKNLEPGGGMCDISTTQKILMYAFLFVVYFVIKCIIFFVIISIIYLSKKIHGLKKRI